MNTNGDDKKNEGANEQSGDQQNSTPTPPTNPTEGASVETGDAQQGGDPAPAAATEAASTETAPEAKTIPFLLSGALSYKGDVDPNMGIGDAIRKLGIDSAPSNYTIRDAVTGNAVKLSDPVSSLSMVDSMQRASLTASGGKGSSSQGAQAAAPAAAATTTRKAAGG